MAEINVKFVDGMVFIGKADTNHWVAMDTDDQFGGTEAGTKPMELLLIALGGCTGMDVVSILRKKRTSFDKFEIKIQGSIVKDYPKYFDKIDVEYIFYGDKAIEKDVAHAIELSEQKYCGVMNVLRRSGAQITTKYTIHSKE
jgi:putative redox protein